MPLSADGEKIRRKMHETYGEKEGDKIFYSKENGDEKFSELVRKGAEPDSAEWWLLRLLSMTPISEREE